MKTTKYTSKTGDRKAVAKDRKAILFADGEEPCELVCLDHDQAREVSMEWVR